MNKDLKYYMRMKYPIEITKIPADEGGGYSVCIPKLGRNVFLADGETLVEALKNLEEIKKEWFEYYIDHSLDIPAYTKQ
jgi:antitoxin HicB